MIEKTHLPREDPIVMLKRFQASINAIVNPFIWTDLKGDITRINKRAREVLGEIEGQQYNTVLQELLGIQNFVQTVMQQGSVTPDKSTFLGVLEKEDGKLDLYQAIGTIVPDENDGTPWFLQSQLLNISHESALGIGLSNISFRDSRKLIQFLSLISALHDPEETGAHLHRVQQNTERVVRFLRQETNRVSSLTPEEQELITLCSPLHDTGKIVTPKDILRKPGHLNDLEMLIMQGHPVEGVRIAQRIPDLPQIAIDIMLYHHARWDGNGYPALSHREEGLKTLKREEIPVSARIVAVVDVFDAICSKRSYKNQIPLEEAKKTLKKLGGTALDPVVVDCVLRHAHELVRETEEVSL